MDYQYGRALREGFRLYGVRHLDLETILDCGQAFRWEKTEEDTFAGIAFGRYSKITQEEDTLLFHQATEEEFQRIWYEYFDFGRDYGALKKLLSKDPVLRRAVAYSPGMRVLRQEGWEALCSFIFSQNNNIKRIKGLVDRFCRAFGEEIPGGYAFPTPDRVAHLTVEDMAPVRSGFRTKYILAAAGAVSGGKLPLEELHSIPLADARALLRTIHGVGPKVAECALLYGFHRTECLPLDVWMNRVMAHWYPEGFPEYLRPVAGLAQQYLFHYARMVGIAD